MEQMVCPHSWTAPVFQTLDNLTISLECGSDQHLWLF